MKLLILVALSFCFFTQANIEKQIYEDIRNNNIESVVKAIHLQHISANHQDMMGISLLQVAVANGHIDMARALLRKGAKIGLENASGIQAIHIAAITDDSEMLQFLIDNGAKIEGKDENNLTAMHWASRTGSVNAMQTLHENGANENALSKNKWSPLHFAAFHAQEEAVDALIAMGVKQTTNSLGYTAIHLTMYSAQQGVISEAMSDSIQIGKHYTISAQKADAYINIANALLRAIQKPKPRKPKRTTPET